MALMLCPAGTAHAIGIAFAVDVAMHGAVVGVNASSMAARAWHALTEIVKILLAAFAVAGQASSAFAHHA